MEEQRESTAERIPNGVQHEIIDGNDQQGQHLVDRRLDLQEYPYGPCPYPVLNTRPAGQKEPYNETTSCVFPVNGAIPPGHKSTPSQYDTASSVTPGAPSDELPLSGFTFPGSWPPVPTASGLEAELRKAKTPPAGNWATGSRPTSDIDVSISSFLAEMPTNSQDPTRHVLWTELVRLKTRTLELQIAEAKQKEKEAELELARLKAVAERKAGPNGGDSNVALDQLTAGPPAGSSTTGTAESFHPLDTYPLIAHARPPMDVGPTGMQNCLNIPQEANGAPYDTVPTPMTPFDVEAMMQDSNMDSLFSWLPDFGETTRNDAYHQTAIDPSNLLASVPNKAASHSSTLDEFREPLPAEPVPFTSPSVKHQRSLSPASSSSSAARTKKTKRNGEKKIVVEHSSACLTCSKPLARILIRAPKSQIPKKISVDFRCRACRAVAAPAVVPDPQTMGTPIGTVETRKRLRSQMEVDDEVPDEESRKAFCDVCQRIVGSGRVVGGEHKENMGRMAEIVCSSCDSKYQRCTDCGGGGGPRVGIGKWRMKQVFQPGRKTCSLSHSRLGDQPREIGVHVTPTDLTSQQLKEVLTRCKGLWKEKTLSRLAVPEMLEIDLPPDLMNPLQHYDDVEDIVTRNWPTREAMIRAVGADPDRFKRLLGLTWAHAKPRRNVRTVDLEEEYAKAAEAEDNGDMSTVLANVKRTNVVIPAGSDLVGMWGGEWDMQHGSLLISTLIPFEGTDGEDSTALSVGEMITKIQSLRQTINTERTKAARKEGTKPELVPQCEHLWVVSGGTMPLVRERMADILIRKRSFVHVDEYLTRHPDFINALRARPIGLHPDLHRPLRGQEGADAKPLVLVRWLGKDFDAQKILEIKRQEFGGKAKSKKRPKSRV